MTTQSSTSQIDVLIHDMSKPVVFRDGDLVFVTPDAVLGIIEVKASVGRARFGEAADRLARNIEMIRLHPNTDAFSAFFAFEMEGAVLDGYLERVVTAAPTWNHRLDFAAIGDSYFIKYWHFDPKTQRRFYESWHDYDLPGLAPAYFVHNVIDAVSPQSVLSNNDVWFPAEGKEPHRIGTRRGHWTVREAADQMEQKKRRRRRGVGGSSPAR